MQQTDLQYFKRWFKKYVAQFQKLSDDAIQPIILKEQHTERTCQEILLLARDLELSEGDMMLAETAALFHDIGRFPQWKYYATFIDSKSRDHAELGLEVLAEHRVLMRLTPSSRKLVHEAIRHHNLRRLPKNLSPRQFLFSRLLRDADKLDIWRVIIAHQRERSQLLETLAGNIPSSLACSREILAELRQGKSADSNLVLNINDLRLVRLGWVFDLNFAASCREVLKRDYIEELSSPLPGSEEIKNLKEYLISYLKNRSSDGS